ncbi:MAG: hypothetical protein R3C56_08550 [Pirellulaceae bacterium]
MRYQNDLDTYALAGGELRLRVGTNEASPLPPSPSMPPRLIQLHSRGATNPEAPPGRQVAGSQSVLINGKIENTIDTPLDFPGGNDELRAIVSTVFQANVEAGADPTNGITSQFYNFQGAIGTGRLPVRRW